jgi:H+/Cl- antiporter ClcA
MIGGKCWMALNEDKNKDTPANSLIKSALKLEYSTNAGRLNITITLGIIVLGVIFASCNYIVEIIYMAKFNKEYPQLSFYDVLIPFLICGGLCFLYMVFIADKYYKIKNQVNNQKNVPKKIKISKH